jgi:hypothetical protein
MDTKNPSMNGFGIRAATVNTLLDARRLSPKHTFLGQQLTNALGKDLTDDAEGTAYTHRMICA